MVDKNSGIIHFFPGNNLADEKDYRKNQGYCKCNLILRGLVGFIAFFGKF